MFRACIQGAVKPMLRHTSLQARRTYYSAEGGPPKIPLSNFDIAFLGIGHIVVMMIVPMWGLFSVPGWRKAAGH